MKLSELEAVLRKCWTKETCGHSEWTPENPSRGQCFVTALVVQDYFGGEILITLVNTPGSTGYHWYNRLPSGEEIDFTKGQFPKYAVFGEGQVDNEARDFLKSKKPLFNTLKFITLREQYGRLKSAVQEELRKMRD